LTPFKLGAIRKHGGDMMSLITEKSREHVSAMKDYPSSVYFGVIALFCIYELFAGTHTPSAFVAGPLLYVLLVSAFFMFFLFFVDFVLEVFHYLKVFTIKRLDCRHKEFESINRKILPEALFVLTIFSLIISTAVYFQVKQETRYEFFEGFSLLILAFSIIQIIIASFPFRAIAFGWRVILTEWSESITYVSVIPGIVILLGILMNFVIFGLVFSSAQTVFGFSGGQFSIFIFALTYAFLSFAYLFGIKRLAEFRIN
jgi:hypothetical protein